jgi:hypothetical protein
MECSNARCLGVGIQQVADSYEASTNYPIQRHRTVKHEGSETHNFYRPLSFLSHVTIYSLTLLRLDK